MLEIVTLTLIVDFLTLGWFGLDMGAHLMPLCTDKYAAMEHKKATLVIDLIR